MSAPRQHTSPKTAAAPQAPQRQRIEILEGAGTIKAVPSATSVTIVGKPINGPPPEITVYFEGVDSPRFRQNRITNPTAYVLREILRKFCIGKQCTFRTDRDLLIVSYSFFLHCYFTTFFLI